MDASHKQARVKKRSSNACQRCRKQKIKCTGTKPCNTCSKRKLTCTFDDRDQKILVTIGFIDDLQRKVALLQNGEESAPSSRSFDGADQDGARELEDDDVDNPGPSPGDNPVSNADPQWSWSFGSATDLTNPLSTGQSTFMATSTGRTFYLGTSSNWSFARKVLSMTYEHIYHTPLPPDRLLFDGAAYDLGWDGSRTTTQPETAVVPTSDFALYLVNAVKFHTGQLFHLFDEETFMSYLDAFYTNPGQQMACSELYYIHFLLILALGKAFVVQKNQGKRPSGGDFFSKAMQLLPDTTCLCRDPIISTEILCCIALYLQALDFRNPAHNFIGQALRIALAQGMHTDMPAEHLGEAFVQRCRKIWWTIYILDRQMTFLMGLPQSIQDDQLHHQLPSFLESPKRMTALSMQVKLCRIIAEINSTVYGIDGRLNRKFLLRTKSALANTADLADELRNQFDLRLDESSISGVSRLAAHLHLLYHQCMVLATRPILFCFLKIQFQSSNACRESLISSPNVRKLLHVCVDSAQQMLNILSALRAQSILDSFLPFDLESTFVSAIVLSMAPAIDPVLLDDRTSWLQKSYEILDEMQSRGNVIAEFRKFELEQLNDMLTQLSTNQPFHGDGQMAKRELTRATPDVSSPQLTLDNPNHTLGVPEILSISNELTTEEIMAVADSIDMRDVDWVAHTVTDNSIW